MPKVSVVIAMYNAEKTIERCIDSIIAQTLTDIEILPVDDGSTDSSADIIRRYAESDARIRLIQQENAGPGAARNTGLQNATGEYVVFWDSDDCFDAEALRLLYERAEATKADVVVCGANRFYPVENFTVKYDGYLDMSMLDTDADTFNATSNPDYILNFTCEAAWNKLFRRSFIVDNGIMFPSFRNGEDAYFTFLSLCLAGKIAVIDEALVTYTKDGEGSLTRSLSKAPLGPFKAWEETCKALQDRNALPERSFVNRICASYSYLIGSIDDYDALKETFEYLKAEGLAKVLMIDRPPEYYYKERYAEFATHILHDSFADFLFYRSCSVNARLHDAGVRNARQKERIQRLSEKAEKREEKLTSLSEKFEKRGERIEALNEKLEKREAKITSLTDRNEALSAKLEDKRNLIKELKTEKTSLNKEVDSLNSKVDALSDRIADNKATIKRLKTERDKAEAAYDSLKASTAYRLGSALLKLPRKVKKLFKRLFKKK